jgi:hypothetical protein
VRALIRQIHYPNDKVIMKMVISRGYLYFNMGSEPWYTSLSRVLSLTEAYTPEKSAHRSD